MIDDAEEYRAEPGSVRNAGAVLLTYPSSRSRDVFMQKIASRWQSVNQCESTTTATSSEENESTERIPSS